MGLCHRVVLGVQVLKDINVTFTRAKLFCPYLSKKLRKRYLIEHEGRRGSIHGRSFNAVGSWFPLQSWVSLRPWGVSCAGFVGAPCSLLPPTPRSGAVPVRWARSPLSPSTTPAPRSLSASTWSPACFAWRTCPPRTGPASLRAGAGRWACPLSAWERRRAGELAPGPGRCRSPPWQLCWGLCSEGGAGWDSTLKEPMCGTFLGNPRGRQHLTGRVLVPAALCHRRTSC